MDHPFWTGALNAAGRIAIGAAMKIWNFFWSRKKSAKANSIDAAEQQFRLDAAIHVPALTTQAEGFLRALKRPSAKDEAPLLAKLAIERAERKARPDYPNGSAALWESLDRALGEELAQYTLVAQRPTIPGPPTRPVKGSRR